MTATLLHFPVRQSHDMTPRTDSLTVLGSRMELLEKRLHRENDLARLSVWIDQYLDAGLDLASKAGSRRLQQLQESWLRRMYAELRRCGFDATRPHDCRQLFLEHLYQPFFALRHFYQQQPDGRACLRQLSRDFTTTAHYLV